MEPQAPQDACALVNTGFATLGCRRPVLASGADCHWGKAKHVTQRSYSWRVLRLPSRHQAFDGRAQCHPGLPPENRGPDQCRRDRGADQAEGRGGAPGDPLQGSARAPHRLRAAGHRRRGLRSGGSRHAGAPVRPPHPAHRADPHRRRAHSLPVDHEHAAADLSQEDSGSRYGQAGGQLHRPDGLGPLPPGAHDPVQPRPPGLPAAR